jgi:hypothetical protein
LGSGIRDPGYGINLFRIPDPGVKKDPIPDPGSGSATLIWRAIRGGQITEEYKEAEKKVRNLIRNSKRGFEKKLAAGGGGNKRPFFAYIKRRTQSRPSIGPLKSQDGETVTDSQGMAELLNTCFKEVFTREDAGDAPDPENLQTESVLTTIQFRARDVRKKIRNLKAEGAAGPEGIGPRVLQELQQEMAPATCGSLCKILRRRSGTS